MPAAESASLPPGTGGPARPKPSRLWLWFVAAFVVQALVWVAWFSIAARHRVQEVPVVVPR